MQATFDNNDEDKMPKKQKEAVDDDVEDTKPNKQGKNREWIYLF